MAAKILKMELTHFPACRFIGRRYGMADKIGGSFSAKWDAWFAGDLFAPLEALEGLAQNEDGYSAMMRMNGATPEYWIGMFFPQTTPAPAGYEAADLAAADFAVAWLYGDEQSGELYDMHGACVEAMQQQGLTPAKEIVCFERYACPRFTQPDEQGKVILDYGIAVEA